MDALYINKKNYKKYIFILFVLLVLNMYTHTLTHIC